MPSAGEYALPVRLRVGADRTTTWLLIACGAALVTMALALSPASLHLKLTVLLFLVALIALLLLDSKTRKGSELLLYGDGKARLQQPGAEATEGELQQPTWQTPWISVLRFRQGNGRQFLPVYRHLQAEHAYRRMQVLLRHGNVAQER